jgi:hypothetical protein
MCGKQQDMSKYCLKIFRLEKKLLGRITRYKRENRKFWGTSNQKFIGRYVCQLWLWWLKRQSSHDGSVLLEQRFSGGSRNCTNRPTERKLRTSSRLIHCCDTIHCNAAFCVIACLMETCWVHKIWCNNSKWKSLSQFDI